MRTRSPAAHTWKVRARASVGSGDASGAPAGGATACRSIFDHSSRVAPAMGIAELTRQAVHVLPEGALEAKLSLDRPLRVKLGIDVTTPDVTLGHGIPLQRMAAFQREGHVGVLIVGDYTTRIGDPSGRSAERPMIEPE